MDEIIFNLYEAKSALSQLVERAAAGEEIVIAKSGRPMAMLVAVSPRRKPRQPGGWEGKVKITKTFDSPLPARIRSGFAQR